MKKFQLRVPKKLKEYLLEIYIKRYKWKFNEKENRISKQSKANDRRTTEAV